MEQDTELDISLVVIRPVCVLSRLVRLVSSRVPRAISLLFYVKKTTFNSRPGIRLQDWHGCHRNLDGNDIRNCGADFNPFLDGIHNKLEQRGFCCGR
ncbi:hypothetical protein K2173_010938 [Erythroxylum novogranatense]|uniref:Uncharacterized protein n=1 Tax=Erythroxylum novogranatense TaxID=1862640 RepID=A0AAV8T098_9ROSI|nr:hypothetical protein K2173_010938 [Erythroxylum novogranatense]